MLRPRGLAMTGGGWRGQNGAVGFETRPYRDGQRAVSDERLAVSDLETPSLQLSPPQGREDKMGD